MHACLNRLSETAKGENFVSTNIILGIKLSAVQQLCLKRALLGRLCVVACFLSFSGLKECSLYLNLEKNLNMNLMHQQIPMIGKLHLGSYISEHNFTGTENPQLPLDPQLLLLTVQYCLLLYAKPF